MDLATVDIALVAAVVAASIVSVVSQVVAAAVHLLNQKRVRLIDKTIVIAARAAQQATSSLKDILIHRLIR